MGKFASTTVEQIGVIALFYAILIYYLLEKTFYETTRQFIENLFYCSLGTSFRDFYPIFQT